MVQKLLDVEISEGCYWEKVWLLDAIPQKISLPNVWCDWRKASTSWVVQEHWIVHQEDSLSNYDLNVVPEASAIRRMCDFLSTTKNTSIKYIFFNLPFTFVCITCLILFIARSRVIRLERLLNDLFVMWLTLFLLSDKCSKFIRWPNTSSGIKAIVL